jgi:septum formation protein
LQKNFYMSAINYDLSKIRAIVFDVDGVLSPATVPMDSQGRPMRMANIKDGYALQLAARRGLLLAIITGGDSPAVEARFRALGFNDVFMKADSKLPVLRRWMEANSLAPEQVAYIGDDIPDLPSMHLVGLPVAPADAAPEVKQAAAYISPVAGGYGVGRDVVEQILKAQGLWLDSPQLTTKNQQLKTNNSQLTTKNPLGNLAPYRIILASGSPRRRQLLEMLGIDFEVIPAPVENEDYPPELPAEEIPEYLALKKIDACDFGPDTLVITADTVVIAGGKVLGKPADADEARAMLRLLSGATHKVVTGVAVRTATRRESFRAVTAVTFAELSEGEIEWYISTYRPFDKAGAYGIQEWIGCIGVTSISGSYYNVMGLPVQRLYRVLSSI